MKLHENSLSAYYAGRLEVFPRRTVEILGALSQVGRATDRQVCEHLGFTDMNAVRPRLTELVKSGVVEEVGRVLDPTTDRHVRLLRIIPRHASEQMALKLEVA